MPLFCPFLVLTICSLYKNERWFIGKTKIMMEFEQIII
nr:MAG TPA: hypothetical protein [Caudoviricetes sp.]